MNLQTIGSPDNPQLKAVRKLAQSGRERRKAGLTLLDGWHLIEAWLASGRPVQKILIVATSADHAEARRLLAAHSEVPVLAVAPGLYADTVGEDFPAGVLAVVAMPPSPGLPDAMADTLVLDGVQDPGNLGSLLRSAAAAGFSQAVLSAACAQPWSPKVLRAGMGAHFALRIFEAVDLAGFLDGYRGRIAVTHLAGAYSLYALDLREPLAWVFGSEGGGVGAEVVARATWRVRIPMPGAVESLNVGAAAAVCLFETLRQRGAGVAR